MQDFKVLGLLLLGSCGVLFVCSESVASEETTVQNDAEVTLSTELQPPPPPAAGEHRGIVYLINLFAVKNKTTETPDEKAENVLNDESPEIIGPLASLLLVVDEDDDGEVTFDDLAKELITEDYDTEGGKSKENLGEVVIDSIIEKPESTEDKPKKPKKIRSKRTLSKKCKTCGGGGGGYNYYPTGGGGGYPTGGGGGYPTGGGQTVGVIPIVVLPIGLTGNNGGGRGGGRGHGGGNYGGGGGGYYQYPNGGGGGNNYYPNGGGGGYNYHPNGQNYGGGYPSGGGGGGRGGGGSNSYSQASAQASAQATSSNW